MPTRKTSLVQSPFIKILTMDALKFVAIFVVVTMISSISGNPYNRPLEESPVGQEMYCLAVKERDMCTPILLQAFNHSDTGLKNMFTHYCSEIQPFVPCVEENREDFLELMNCSASILASEMGHIWGDLLTIEEQLDLILGIFDAVNNILCNRIDEVTNLGECIESKDRQFQQLMRRCIASHVMPLMSRNMGDNRFPDRSTWCPIMYGFISCLKDGMVGLCGEDYFDLLETTYEEVFVEVIGDAFGCIEENEPLFDFVRSLKEKFRS